MEPTIVLDVDGVLADWLGWAHPRFCKLLGVDVPFELLNDYDPAKSYKVTHEQFESARSHLESTYDTARLLPVVDGAIDALEKLSRSFCIVLATARHEPIHQATRDWLAKRVEPVAGPLEIFFTGAVNNPYAIELPSSSKLEVCRYVDAVVLVEDNPHEIGALDGSGVEPVCIGWPWNECLTKTHPHVMRGDWGSIAMYLLEKYAQKREA